MQYLGIISEQQNDLCFQGKPLNITIIQVYAPTSNAEEAEVERFYGSKMVKGLPFEATLPETTITRTEAKNAFYELREQAADVPEMSLDEINAEISAVRAEKKGKC